MRLAGVAEQKTCKPAAGEETFWVVHRVRGCRGLEEEIAGTELTLLVVLECAAHVQSEVEGVTAARVKPIVGDSKSMFAINCVQPPGRAPTHRLRRADKGDSRQEGATAGIRLDAAKIPDRFLLMVVKYLSGPAHARSHY